MISALQVVIVIQLLLISYTNGANSVLTAVQSAAKNPDGKVEQVKKMIGHPAFQFALSAAMPVHVGHVLDAYDLARAAHEAYNDPNDPAAASELKKRGANFAVGLIPGPGGIIAKAAVGVAISWNEKPQEPEIVKVEDQAKARVEKVIVKNHFQRFVTYIKKKVERINTAIKNAATRARTFIGRNTRKSTKQSDSKSKSKRNA